MERPSAPPVYYRNGSECRESVGKSAVASRGSTICCRPLLAQDNQGSVPRLYLSASGALVMPADVHVDFHDASGSPNGGMDGAFDRGPGLVLVMGYGQK